MLSIAFPRGFIGVIAAMLLLGLTAPLHAKDFIKGERPQQRKSLAGDLDGQVRQIFKLLNATLEKAGGKLSDMVQMTVFITDVRYGDRLTQIRREIFGDNFPGSALITVTALAIPEAKVEIQGYAAIASKQLRRDVVDVLDRWAPLPGRASVNWLRYGCAIAAVAAGVVAFGAPTAALPQDYPTRPIRLLVVTAAGGLMDVAARVTAEHVGKALGQSIVIENRPGGGGNLGAEAIAKATPDGYTIGLIQLGNVAINPHIYADMTFDPLNDLMPVAPVTTSPILVVANAKSRPTTCGS